MTETMKEMMKCSCTKKKKKFAVVEMMNIRDKMARKRNCLSSHIECRKWTKNAEKKNKIYTNDQQMNFCEYLSRRHILDQVFATQPNKYSN